MAGQGRVLTRQEYALDGRKDVASLGSSPQFTSVHLLKNGFEIRFRQGSESDSPPTVEKWTVRGSGDSGPTLYREIRSWTGSVLRMQVFTRAAQIVSSGN